MFKCNDRHPMIQHDEFSCPLCAALDDLRFCRMMSLEHAGELLTPTVRKMLDQRIEEGCC